MSVKDKSKKRLSRENILDSALRIIGTNGIYSLTHRSVAKEAKVAHSTVSYYFRTIDDLTVGAFKKLIADDEAVSDVQLLNLVEKKGTFSIEEFVGVIASGLKSKHKSGYLLQAEYELFVYSSRNKELAEAMRNARKRDVNGVQKLLDRKGYKNVDAEIILSIFGEFARDLVHNNLKGAELKVKKVLNLIEKLKK